MNWRHLGACWLAAAAAACGAGAEDAAKGHEGWPEPSEQSTELWQLPGYEAGRLTVDSDHPLDVTYDPFDRDRIYVFTKEAVYVGSLAKKTFTPYCGQHVTPLLVQSGQAVANVQSDGSLVVFAPNGRWVCQAGTGSEKGTGKLENMGGVNFSSRAILTSEGLLVPGGVVTWTGSVSSVPTAGTLGTGPVFDDFAKHRRLLAWAENKDIHVEEVDNVTGARKVLATHTHPDFVGSFLVVDDIGVVFGAGNARYAWRYQDQDAVFVNAGQVAVPLFFDASGSLVFDTGERLTFPGGKLESFKWAEAPSYMSDRLHRLVTPTGLALEWFSHTIDKKAGSQPGDGDSQMWLGKLGSAPGWQTRTYPSPKGINLAEQQRYGNFCVLISDHARELAGPAGNRVSDSDKGVAAGTYVALRGGGSVALRACDGLDVTLLGHSGGMALYHQIPDGYPVADGANGGQILRKSTPVFTLGFARKRAKKLPNVSRYDALEGLFDSVYSGLTWRDGKFHPLFDKAEVYFLRPYDDADFVVARQGKLYLVKGYEK